MVNSDCLTNPSTRPHHMASALSYLDRSIYCHLKTCFFLFSTTNMVKEMWTRRGWSTVRGTC